MPHIATHELIWNLRRLERVTAPADRPAVTGICLALAYAAQASRDDDGAVAALFAGFRAGVTPTTPYAASEADRLKRAVMWCRLGIPGAATDEHADFALRAATSWLWAEESGLGFSLSALASNSVTTLHSQLATTLMPFAALGVTPIPAVTGDIAALADGLAACFPGMQGSPSAAQAYLAGTAVFGNERAEGRLRLARALWLLDHRADGYLRIDNTEAVSIRGLAKDVVTDWREEAVFQPFYTKCCPAQTR